MQAGHTSFPAAGHGTGSKKSKPAMEKRRRARINASLSELRALIPESVRKDTHRFNKMEKADVLEMTVSYLRQLQEATKTGKPPTDNCKNKYNSSNNNNNSSNSNKTSYTLGFNECAQEVSQFFRSSSPFSSGLKRNLLDHLKGCAPHNPPDSPSSSPTKSTTAPALATSREPEGSSLTNSIISRCLMSTLDSQSCEVNAIPSCSSNKCGDSRKNVSTPIAVSSTSDDAADAHEDRLNGNMPDEALQRTVQNRNEAPNHLEPHVQVAPYGGADTVRRDLLREFEDRSKNPQNENFVTRDFNSMGSQSPTLLRSGDNPQINSNGRVSNLLSKLLTETPFIVSSTPFAQVNKGSEAPSNSDNSLSDVHAISNIIDNNDSNCNNPTSNHNNNISNGSSLVCPSTSVIVSANKNEETRKDVSDEQAGTSDYSTECCRMEEGSGKTVDKTLALPSTSSTVVASIAPRIANASAFLIPIYVRTQFSEREIPSLQQAFVVEKSSLSSSEPIPPIQERQAEFFPASVSDSNVNSKDSQVFGDGANAHISSTSPPVVLQSRNHAETNDTASNPSNVSVPATRNENYQKPKSPQADHVLKIMKNKFRFPGHCAPVSVPCNTSGSMSDEECHEDRHTSHVTAVSSPRFLAWSSDDDMEDDKCRGPTEAKRIKSCNSKAPNSTRSGSISFQRTRKESVSFRSIAPKSDKSPQTSSSEKCTIEPLNRASQIVWLTPSVTNPQNNSPPEGGAQYRRRCFTFNSKINPISQRKETFQCANGATFLTGEDDILTSALKSSGPLDRECLVARRRCSTFSSSSMRAKKPCEFNATAACASTSVHCPPQSVSNMNNNIDARPELSNYFKNKIIDNETNVCSKSTSAPLNGFFSPRKRCYTTSSLRRPNFGHLETISFEKDMGNGSEFHRSYTKPVSAGTNHKQSPFSPDPNDVPMKSVRPETVESFPSSDQSTTTFPRKTMTVVKNQITNERDMEQMGITTSSNMHYLPNVTNYGKMPIAVTHQPSSSSFPQGCITHTNVRSMSETLTSSSSISLSSSSKPQLLTSSDHCFIISTDDSQEPLNLSLTKNTAPCPLPNGGTETETSQRDCFSEDDNFRVRSLSVSSGMSSLSLHARRTYEMTASLASDDDVWRPW